MAIQNVWTPHQFAPLSRLRMTVDELLENQDGDSKGGSRGHFEKLSAQSRKDFFDELHSGVGRRGELQDVILPIQ